ncbi:MAG TPA: hypothetical protein PK978_00740 [Paludibacter sp.]|nr:hypothetical protein [Paludibacter sp.]
MGEHYFNDDVVLTGNLDGLKVSLSRHQMKIYKGSLCKWYLGDNFQTMGRSDTQRAIEKLSDTLHLPMSKATITRIDIAQNIITKHPPNVYFNHLGTLKYANRLQQPSGLYYRQAGGQLCFYDKFKEQKSNKGQIPELYEGKNVLRYEHRHTNRIASRLNVQKITGATLYDEAFYINLLKLWKESYNSIQKINDISINFEAMRTKQQLYKMGVLSLVGQAGGQLQMIEQINEAQKRGDLTKKQAYDLRQAVNEACQIKEGLTVPNEAITELNKKINEAVKFYR